MSRRATLVYVSATVVLYVILDGALGHTAWWVQTVVFIPAAVIVGMIVWVVSTRNAVRR